MDNFKKHISAIILVSEKHQTVSIHFSGFQNYEQAHDFSRFMVDELGIETFTPFDPLQIPPNTTFH